MSIDRARVDSTRIRLNNSQLLLEDFERRKAGYYSRGFAGVTNYTEQKQFLTAERDRRRKEHFEAINEYHELVRRYEDAEKLVGITPKQEVLRALLTKQKEAA